MTRDEFKTLYTHGCDLVSPYIRLEGQELKDWRTHEARQCLSQGIAELEKCLQDQPENWAARWFIGKAYQVQERHEEAYNYFRSAHQNNIGHPDVLRELTLECLKLKKHNDAIYYCRTAIEFKPEDATLWANFATVLMLAGRLDEAVEWANKTLTQLPDDLPANNVLQIIKEVREGSRKTPESFDELEGMDNAGIV